MQKKTKRSYEIMFNAIHDLLPPNQQDGPEKFFSDFEHGTLYRFGTFMNGQYMEFPERVTLQRNATDGGR